MGKTKTHEQFVEELRVVNPKIMVLGEYFSSKTKLKVRCLVDGHEWLVRADSLLEGRGCHKCFTDNITKTHEQFVEELRAFNPKIEVLGEYVNAKTKLKVRCLVDCHEWSVTPSGLLAGKGCYICSLKSKTKTHEQFVEELQVVNPKIEVLGVYVNSATKLKVRCMVDGYEWLVGPSGLLGNHGCPRCRDTKRTKTHSQFVEELGVINPRLECLEEYVTKRTKLKVRCLIDNYEWAANPSGLLQGSGCPACVKIGFKTHEPADFYVYEFDDYYGFGITNNLKRRHKEHKMNFKKNGVHATLLKTFQGDGLTIQQLEAQVKQTFNIVDIGIEGFRTEAVLKADGCKLLEFIKQTLDKSQITC